MKRKNTTIVSLALLSALAFAGAAGLCAQKQSLTASADTPVAELISPTTYEQYLFLTSPTAVAATQDYTAIADGNTVYIYDRADNVYRQYTHTEEISQIAFDETGHLYFLSELNLWKLPADDPSEAIPVDEVNCLGFTLHDNALYYYATAKKIKRYSLTDGSTQEYALPNTLQTDSPLAFGKGNLYCVCDDENGYAVYEIDPATKSTRSLVVFPERINSMAIANNLFCAVTKSGFFRVYNLANLNGDPITDTSADTNDINGYVSLCAIKDDLYVIRGNSIRFYATETTSFTDFEINAASSSSHRLDGANELFLSENKLFIADDNNDRISVYNTTTRTFEQAIPTTLASPFLSSYDKTLLVSSVQEATLYNLAKKGYGETLLHIPTESLNGNVIGATCVYDRYYLLTDGGYCYTITQTDGAWGYEQTQTIPYATAFASDVYGCLYVVYNDGDLYRFTEKELTTPNANGTKILEDLPDVEKLTIDYETNLYALNDGVLTKYTPNEGSYAQSATYTPSYGLVNDDSPYLISLTFGVEDKYAYFLYENNYVVKSDELQIPIVNPVPVGDAASRVFGAENRDFAVVTVAQDAILTEFDLSALQGATEFPYVAFERCHTPMTALKFGEENGYSILAVPAGAVGYKTYLVLSDSCEEISLTDYRVDYAETPKIGYLTNDVSVYKFPYLCNLLTIADLPRGAEVTLLGEVKKLNHEYYEISYTNEHGETVMGFIPKDYALLFDGKNPTSETVTYGETEDDRDTVWRFAYITLGFVAIGILVDFLLLHKPKETD